MLDQNTDRMWYVIGAVIIGAAIIFIANGALPDLFASVGTAFTGTADKAQQSVADIQIGWQSVGPEHIDSFYSRVLDYDEETETFRIEINPDTAHRSVDSGVQIKEGSLRVPFNYRHTINYEIRLPFDSTTRQDVNTRVSEGEPWALYGRIDNDEWASRRFNGHIAEPGVDYDDTRLSPVMSQDVPGNVWHSMTYSYTNTDSGNVNQIDLLDTSSFGIMVPEGQTEPFVIEIRGIRNIVEEL